MAQKRLTISELQERLASAEQKYNDLVEAGNRFLKENESEICAEFRASIAEDLGKFGIKVPQPGGTLRVNVDIYLGGLPDGWLTEHRNQYGQIGVNVTDDAKDRIEAIVEKAKEAFLEAGIDSVEFRDYDYEFDEE